MRVLIISKGYLPGYKYGGPIRSLAGMVNALGEHIDFCIVASLFDSGESTPYPGIEPDTWTEVGSGQVLYKSEWNLSAPFLRRVIEEIRPDAIYLNSFFEYSTRLVLFWRRLGLLSGIPVIVAPRGEFGSGAIQMKGLKKRSYLRLAQYSGLCRDVSWQVSSAMEADDLRRAIPHAKKIFVAPNLPSAVPGIIRDRPKKLGHARFVFVARIVENKNLLQAIHVLQNAHGSVSLHVYGPLEDRQYWSRCLSAAANLPANVEFSYCGELPHHEILERLNDYDFFMLPTFSENFGHAIAEALQIGLPVIISDQTPWQNLEQSEVGWSLALADEAGWSRAVAQCISMDDATYQSMSLSAKAHVQRWLIENGAVQASIRMFEESARL